MAQLITVIEGKQTGETIYFTLIECCNCGMPFMVPQRLKINWQEDKTVFYCPNGHGQSYNRSKAEILEQKLKATEERNRIEREELENRLLDEINERKKQERKLKRVHNGVCPCCNRSFINLKRHMKTKHPETIGVK